MKPEVAAARKRYFGARRLTLWSPQKEKEPSAPESDRFSNAEMLEILQRHERAILDAARKAGLPSGYEYVGR